MRKILFLFLLLLTTQINAQCWLEIDSGFAFSIGIKGDGTLWGWGLNKGGQLGDGTTVDKCLPIQCGTDKDWLKVDCGYDFAVAQKSDGTLWAWGINGDGQLGTNNGAALSSVPQQIGVDKDWIAFSAGLYHVLAVKANGTLWGWGDAEAGALTQFLKGNILVPTKIGTSSDWLKVSCGDSYSLAVKTNGTLWGWGKNYNGQTGNPNPAAVVNMGQSGTATDWVSICAGNNFSLALKSNGSLWAWGENYYGQLGDGTTTNKIQFTQISSGSKWSKINSGTYNSMGIKVDGSLWTWGRNLAGEIGNGNNLNQTTPYHVGSDIDWQDIATGYHSLSLKSNGQLYGWGSNSNGQNGIGSAGDLFLPAQITCETPLLTIIAPAAVTVNAGSNCMATGVALGTPVTAGNCSVASVTNNAPTTFPLGNTTVTWTVKDASNNIATATQIITVNDVTLPTISAPPAVMVNVTSNCMAAGVELGTPVTADNCSVTSVTNDAPSAFPLGSTAVTWTVKDGSNNVATATQIVTVNDMILPTITSPANLTVIVTSNCTASGVELGTPLTADNCSVASVINNAPTAFPIGNTTVIWTVKDSSNNTATATQVVTVKEMILPTITAPAALTINTGSNCTATGVVLGTPVTADNCSVASVTNDAPTIFPLGNTTVIWTVKDTSNNTVTATQLVTVKEMILPTITAPAAVTVNAGSNCTATGVTLGTPLTADNCSVASVTNDAPATFPLGNTTVTWTVKDTSNNTATATQLVTVNDLTLPSITAPAAVTINVGSNCTATGIVLGTPVTADNCSVASVTNDAPTIFPLGNTTVIWTVKDTSNNTATATQVVTVKEMILPTITAPAAVTVNPGSNCTATGVTLGTPLTADNCSVASVTNDAPATFPLGNTTVTWTVKDSSNNSATATQTVTVNDVTLPTITAPAAVTVNADSNGTASTGVELGTPVTADNCSVASLTNDAPSIFPLGNTTVTWIVKDASNNTAMATQIVTVKDVTPPTVPTNLSASATTATTTTLSWTASTDNVGASTSGKIKDNVVVIAYDVYQDNILLATVTATTYTVTGLKPGQNYSFIVRAKDAAGNVSQTSYAISVTTITDTLGTDHFNKQDTVKLYPNPTNGNVTIDITSLENAQLNVFDVTGRFIFSKELKGASTLNISNLPIGVYMFRISNDSGTVTKRVIKN